jgi:hypothetical protein
MSWCVDLSARARGLIALQCTCACSFQLLLIYDVESPLSMLAGALAAVGSCCLLAVGADFVVLWQGIPDGRRARWAASSTISGVVDG